MPVSGLLLTVDPDPTTVAALRATLARDPRTTAGELVGSRLVIALDTADRAADEDAWTWLRGLPGVRWVDLAWISIDPADDVARPPKTTLQGAHP